VAAPAALFLVLCRFPPTQESERALRRAADPEHMQYNSHAYGLGSDDEEESPYARSSYGHSSSTPRSLSQQLLATAKKWEAEREREASTQKMKLADANASLRSERIKVGTLTAQISTLKS